MEVVECGEDGSALGRSLKPIPSEHIKAMTKDLSLQTKDTLKLNCTAPNFAEIMHFFRSEDVTSLKSRKKHEAEWKTVGGTISYTKSR
jgi:hypothetical protein